jgi:hypothetical protein
VRGHWLRGQFDAADFGPPEFESLNSGIAIVTPMVEALEVLDGEDFVKERKEQELRRLKENAPTKDSTAA